MNIDKKRIKKILSLKDVKEVAFRPARFREGYLASEVDAFVDDIVHTLSSKVFDGKEQMDKTIKLLQKTIKEKDNIITAFKEAFIPVSEIVDSHLEPKETGMYKSAPRILQQHIKLGLGEEL
ncbi:MAG: DivIVA domain-containing protein [Bifidobacteriaceae bacterium]|jgi:DivIVA domain-containing protein|nr:DivIVA domain-containing protein [Bifidobacteriaceae bacterium]